MAQPSAALMQIRMIDAGIYRELALACSFFLLGIVLAASYDVLRMLRALIAHGIFLVSLEDLLYWLCAAAAVFLTLYEKTNGEVRAYLFGAVAAGMLSYACSFGRIITPRVLRLFRRFRARVAVPLGRAAGYVRSRRRDGAAFCGKVLLCQKKRLKKLCKMVKISMLKL